MKTEGKREKSERERDKGKKNCLNFVYVSNFAHTFNNNYGITVTNLL